MTRAFVPNAAGVQRSTFKIGKYLSEHNVEVGFYSTFHTDQTIPEFGTLYYPEFAGGLNNNANRNHLKNSFKRFRPDVVINQMPYEEILRDALFELKIELHFKLLACLRNSLFIVKNNILFTISNNVSPFLFRLLNNRMAENILGKVHDYKHSRKLKSILDMNDKFILLTPPNIDELEYFVKDYKSDRIECIPNSIPSVAEFDSMQKEKIVLYVGSLNIPQKRVDLLLEVWSIVFGQLPEWSFKVVGGGDYMESMKARISAQKLENIEVLGHQNPEKYYKEASIFLMTSAFEGFPNVLIEAQSYGLVPIVMNSYAALSWIVNDKKDASLISAFDTKKMAEEVIDLANDDQKRSLMSRAASENARRFTIDKVGLQWLKLLERLI